MHAFRITVGSYMNHSSDSGLLSKISSSAKTESAAASDAGVEDLISSTKQDSDEYLANVPGKALQLDSAGKIAEDTLFHDAAMALNNQLKSAKDFSDRLVMKELKAEQKIMKIISDAQRAALRSANVANRAELVAARALAYIENLREQSEYAQNASGQALAAQMAQALGFPVAAKGVPSLFAPPKASLWPFSGPRNPMNVYRSAIDDTCALSISEMNRKRSLSEFI